MSDKEYPRILTPPKSSFFLFGPRGTGKTTWIQKALPQAKFLSLLDEELFQTLLIKPGLFSDELRSLTPRSWVVVDEIQRLPNLLNEVHRFIEDKQKRLNFALTGSSARKLRRVGVNLLAGRAVWREMFPLTPFEMKKQFELSDVLQFGTMPLVVSAVSPKEALQFYVQMYLKEEIQAEAIVRNLSGFARFLPVAALFHGQVLNLSNVARDAGVARPTVEGFLEILEDTLIARRLYPFEGKLRVREKKHPKLYWIDPGLVRATKKNLGQVSIEEKGPLFEGLIFMLLRFYQEVLNRDSIDQISYWSPAEAKNTEVDFLIQRQNEYVAIEVKATDRLRPDHFNGLNAIGDLKNLKRRILIYTGNRSMRTENGIEVFCFDDWIEHMDSKKL